MTIGKLYVDNIDRATSPNRRKVPRIAVRIKATVTSSRGDNSKATIGDLSTHGCNLIGMPAWLRTGNFITIGLDAGDDVQAIVRWTRDDTAGVEFLRPIPPEFAEWRELLDAG